MTEYTGILEKYFDFKRFLEAYEGFGFCYYKKNLTNLNNKFAGGDVKTFWLTILLVANVIVQQNLKQCEANTYGLFPFVVLGVALYLSISYVISIFERNGSINSKRYYMNLFVLHMILMLSFSLLFTLMGLQDIIINLIVISEDYYVLVDSSYLTSMIVYSFLIGLISSIKFILNSLFTYKSNFIEVIFVGASVLFINTLIVFFIFTNSDNNLSNSICSSTNDQAIQTTGQSS